MTLLHWCEAEDDWMQGKGFMEWRCYCDAQVSLIWKATHDLYNTDEPIGLDHPITAWWQLECHGGHVLLLCHELSDDESADTFEAPTTSQIVERLASAEDVAAWRAYEAPKPPWNNAPVRAGQP